MANTETLEPAKALDEKSQAVRVIYYDGQAHREASMASFKRVVAAVKALGASDDAAKVAVLSIADYTSKHLLAMLLENKVVTQDQIDRSIF